MLKLTGYIFAILALTIFIYSFHFTTNVIYQEQAIYWFLIALVSAILPHLKNFKFKDIEFTLQERIKLAEEKIDTSINEMKATLMESVEMIRAKESKLSTNYLKSRKKIFDNFNDSLKKLSPEEQFEKQKYFTRKYLNNYELTLGQLKNELKTRGYYDGPIDDLFNQDVVDAIIKFQTDLKIEPVDGIFGNMSFAKL